MKNKGYNPIISDSHVLWNKGTWALLSLGFVLFAFIIIKLLGLLGAILLVGIPIGFFVIRELLNYPKTAVWLVLILGFLSPGLTRYVPAPWGLSIDILLALAWLSVLLNKKLKFKWKHAKDPVVWAAVIWMAYLVFEIVNPAGNGPMAWFYAMRGIGFYQVMTFPLVFCFLEKKRT